MCLCYFCERRAPLLDDPFTGAIRDLCRVRHHNKSIGCVNASVCRIPLVSHACYIGQTSRCFNDWLIEHKRNVKYKVVQPEVVRDLDAPSHCLVQWEPLRFSKKKRMKESLDVTSFSCCVSNSSQIDDATVRFLDYWRPPRLASCAACGCFHICAVEDLG